jgi:hypothetical protein
VIGIRFLLALPVLGALALPNVTSAPTTSPRSAAAPSAQPQAPPAEGQHDNGFNDDTQCTEVPPGDGCEPAWHHEARQTHAQAPRGRRPPPGSSHGPI